MKKIIFLHKNKLAQKNNSLQENQKNTFDRFIDGELRSNDLDGVKFLDQKNEEEIEFIALMQKVVERQQFISLIKENNNSQTRSLVGINALLFNGYYFRSGMVALLVILGAISILFSPINEGYRRYNYQSLNGINPSVPMIEIDHHNFLKLIINQKTNEDKIDLSGSKNKAKKGKKYFTEKIVVEPRLVNANMTMVPPIEARKYNRGANKYSQIAKDVWTKPRSNNVSANANKNRSDVVQNTAYKKLSSFKFHKKRNGSKLKGSRVIFNPGFINITNETELNLCKTNVNFKKALNYIALKDYKKAEEAFLEAIKAEPTNIFLYQKTGSFYERLGKFGKLERIYTALLKVDPNNVEAYKKRAFVCTINRKYNRAERDYSRLIELQPNNRENYERRGALHKQRAYYDRAEKDYTAIINIDPNNQKTFRSRALFYKTTNQPNKAAFDMVKYYSYIGLTRNFANQLGYFED